MTDPQHTPGDGDSNAADPTTPKTDAPYSIEEKRSLLDDTGEPDVCPNCGRPMPSPDAVVCMHCGFDQVQNKIVRTKVGKVEVEAEAPVVGAGEFVRPGRLGWQTPTIVGCAAIIAAAVLSGMHAQHRPVWEGFATFLFAPVFAGIGVAATLVTSVLMEERFGRLEYAVGRMLMAVGLVELFWHIGQNLETNNWLQFLFGAGLGALAYFGVIWWFFALNRSVALLLSLLHLSLWAVFMGLLRLNAWLATAPVAS